jgi:hypothetical protein
LHELQLLWLYHHAPAANHNTVSSQIRSLLKFIKILFS